YVHFGEQALLPREGIERTFGQAIELDPRFGPAWIHYIEATFQQHADSALAAERVTAYTELAAGSDTERRFNMALAIAFGDSATRTVAWATLDTISIYLPGLALSLGHPSLLEEQGRVLARARRSAGPDPGPHIFWVFNRLSTGRIGAVLTALEEEQSLPPAFPAVLLYTADLGGYPVPRDRVDAALANLEGIFAHEDFPLVPEFGFVISARAAERGDWGTVDQTLRRIRAWSESSLQAGDSTDARYALGIARAVEGVAAWRRGDLERAIPLLEAGRREATGHEIRNGINVMIRLSLAEILVEAGRPEDSLRYFESMSWEPMARFRAAKLYEELERFEEARDGYTIAAQAWAHADPEMRALAEEARQGAIRLGGLRRG
ncbi:MAG: tetratricopeptide repeat protein, partial [Gemmatimonadota bacterium]